ncbi:MAG: hypothetical protein LKJ44_04755 [Bifidobacteriaceae bacterium]|nr:hypothetical protein [Bifidobacteriaceae bacterium]MCI1979008.1 hypothetical protein [Bifidobacteriaceae bacterium]
MTYENPSAAPPPGVSGTRANSGDGSGDNDGGSSGGVSRMNAGEGGVNTGVILDFADYGRLRRNGRVALLIAVVASALFTGASVFVFAHPEIFGVLVLAAGVAVFVMFPVFVVSTAAGVIAATGRVRGHGGLTVLLVLGLVCCAVVALVGVAILAILIPLLVPL